MISNNSLKCTSLGLAGAFYDSVSFPVAAQSGVPVGLFFKSDGTKMYMLGGNVVYQYSLSTAWDLLTASYDSVSKSVNAQTPSATKVFFKPDGAKMYIISAGLSTVYQYTLGTPWDLSTASYDSVSFVTNAQGSAQVGLFFKSDGTKMYAGFDAATHKLYQYTLGTPWDISTASYDSINLNVSAQDLNPNGPFFDALGTTMYIIGAANDKIYQYTLSSAWDLSTASYTGISFPVSAQETSGNMVFFKPGGSRMYIVGSATDAVYQYSVP